MLGCGLVFGLERVDFFFLFLVWNNLLFGVLWMDLTTLMGMDQLERVLFFPHIYTAPALQVNHHRSTIFHCSLLSLNLVHAYAYVPIEMFKW